MEGKKFYVVWKGRKRGIFNSWNECLEQIHSYQGAEYKSFKTRKLAEIAFQGKSSDYIGKNLFEPELSSIQLENIGKPDMESISVDAACSGNPGLLEYRGIYNKTNKEIFRQGPFEEGTNNIGEFLAIVHCLSFLKKFKSNLPIYSDSLNAIKWVHEKKHNSNLARTNKNEKIFDLLEKAEKWLAENQFTNKIIKWETKAWGEIPADFGRK
jgi:ribonuclease HI